MTNGLDPYVGTDFVYDPTAAAMYEAQLVQEEAAGYQHLSVQNYVNALLAAGEQPQPLPTVLDGVWHHDVYLWMGNVGLEDVLEPGTSSDNACHTLAMQAHRKLTEVENVVASLKTHAFDSQIAQAWQALLLGEGSDGTGQNPYIGERKYSEAHSQSALDMANSILADPRIKPHVLPPAPGPSFSDDPGPFELIYDSTAHRLPHISWQKQKDAQTWNLTVAFDAIPNNPDDPSRFTLDISFPRFIDDLISVGALEEQILRDTPLASIAGSQTALSDGGASTTVITPAVNGLIGLGNNWYVIKRTETVHVAAQLPLGDEVVRFHDDSAVTDAVSWQFIVMQGTQTEALAAATAANIEPEAVRVSACGCNTSVADGGVLAFAVLGLAVRRRRRLTR
jgi:MYXO-CTERM domain-containing protein